MNQLQRTQLNTYGRYLTSKSLSEAPTINLKTSDANKRLRIVNEKRKFIPTRNYKNENNNPEIALYNPRIGNSILNQDITGNEMTLTMRKNRNLKLPTENEDLFPNTGVRINFDSNSVLDDITIKNENPYYPKNQIGPYNQMPKNLNPTLLDERINFHTTDRDYAYDGDKVNIMRNLISSPRRWETIARQEEAIRKLKGMPRAVDRWSENHKAYISRPEVPREFLIEEVKRNSDVKKINDFDDVNLVANIEKQNLKAISQVEKPDFTMDNYNHLYSGNDNIVTNRNQNIFTYDNRENFLYLYDNDEIVEIPRENEELVFAPVYMTPKTKLLTFIEDGKLFVVQKANENNFMKEESNDELFLTVLPKDFTEMLRTKIRKSDGRKIQELTEKDFYDLFNFIESNPEIKYRTKTENLIGLLKNDDFDKNLIKNFNSEKILLNEEVLREFSTNDIDRLNNIGKINNEKKLQNDFKEINVGTTIFNNESLDDIREEKFKKIKSFNNNKPQTTFSRFKLE